MTHANPAGSSSTGTESISQVATLPNQGKHLRSVHISNVALAGSVEDPLEASSICSRGALGGSVEDPLEASPLCSKVALAGSVEDPLEASPLCTNQAAPGPLGPPLGLYTQSGKHTYFESRYA